MRSDGTRRRSLLDLFAERQVYIRSGPHSHYVALSRPLQIGVALGFAAVLALLAVAACYAIAGRIELAAQRRALADLAARAEDRPAVSLDGLRERSAAAEAEALRLRAALDDAEVERTAREAAARQADEKIAALSAALEQAQTALETARAEGARQARELQAALAGATAESRSLATRLQEIRASGEVRNAALSGRLEATLTEATGLRAELDRVSREAAALRRAAAQGQPGNPGSTPGTRPAPPAGAAPIDDPSAGQILQLEEELAGAKATIDALTADLAAAKGAPTVAAPSPGRVVNVAADPAQDDPPLPPPPAPR